MFPTDIATDSLAFDGGLAVTLNQRRSGTVNLGDTIDLLDPDLSFDHMHLTAEGNARLAESLVSPVVAMAARQSTSDGRIEH